MISGNPVMNEDTFDLGYDVEQDTRSVMTLQSTLLKSATLIGITVVAATVTWGMVQSGSAMAMPLAIGGAIMGFIIALITVFKPKASPFTAPLYAVAEGLFLGAISAVYNAAFAPAPGEAASPFSGIVVQAVGLTMGVLGIMLGLYVTRIIRVTPKLTAGIIAATGAVFLFYLASFVMNLIWPGSMTLLHDSGPMGIGISLLIVGIAAFNLLLDFDLIEKGVQQRAPKYMEWYAGFALLVTLVWLYFEILRLLAKLRSE